MNLNTLFKLVLLGRYEYGQRTKAEGQVAKVKHVSKRAAVKTPRPRGAAQKGKLVANTRPVGCGAAAAL